MYYINWKSLYGLETIDEVSSLKEAKYLRKEYQLAYGIGNVYISSRSTKEWRNK